MGGDAADPRDGARSSDRVPSNCASGGASGVSPVVVAVPHTARARPPDAKESAIARERDDGELGDLYVRSWARGCVPLVIRMTIGPRDGASCAPAAA